MWGFGGAALTQIPVWSCSICEFPHVVCASPAYLQQYGEPRSPDELKQHQCVMYSLARSPHEWSFWRGTETVIVHVDGAVKVNNSLATSQAAVAELGIIFLTIFVTSEALK